MKKGIIYGILTVCSLLDLSGQNKVEISAILIPDSLKMRVSQRIVYQNTTQDTLNTIYLNDWNNSYSTKTTPLAKRFEEEFSTKFHLAKSSDRGYTVITSLTDVNNNNLQFHYLREHPDVVKVKLKEPLLPNAHYDIHLKYILRFPNDRFTGYGVNSNKDFNLKDWYINPAVYDGKWHYYSNKNLNDMFVPVADIDIKLEHPNTFQIISELDLIDNKFNNGIQISHLAGKNRTDNFMVISKLHRYRFVGTDDLVMISNINEKGLPPYEKVLLTDKITKYLVENLGPYPHQKLLVSELEYERNPLYGLNQLPNFLQPFPDNLQYELKLLKTALKKYIDNVLILNPRKEYWLSEGLQIYLLMKYVEEYYPDAKLLGSIGDLWVIRSSHAADLGFNFQYFLYFMEMARKNNDQPLTTSKDSLVKFNANIAGKYKAGIGLRYLNDYLEDQDLNGALMDFVHKHQLQRVELKDFEEFIKNWSNKDVNWFFDDYLDSRVKYDYKLKKTVSTEDSLSVIIRNKRKNEMPVSLFALQNDSVVKKLWIPGFKGTKVITIPKDSIERVALDYDQIIPEFNQRNNYRSVKKNILLNRKPLQVRLFKDIEDPYYDQVFIMPLIEFNNIYDGLTLGTKFYNKSILRKRLNYNISPQYAFNSKSITGSGFFTYTHNIEGHDLYDITYGIGGSYQSFAQDAFFTSIRPTLTLRFRDKDDFRSDKRDFMSMRLVSIQRNLGPDAIVDVTEPDYNVFNVRYIKSNPGIINYSKFFADYQLADQFSKVSVNFEYRKLTKNNRNFGLRFFAGIFLNNDTDPNSDYFSFALDRPTDYLFDLNYFGRSEATGFFSQQIIIAEGGFKSQLEPAFANQWMTTVNATASIWRYIQAYGDIGLVKNRGSDPIFVYDAGIRLVLVEDYFEIFFPVYSNLGWQIAQPRYAENIRFMFTLDPQVLFSLFTRKWY